MGLGRELKLVKVAQHLVLIFTKLGTGSDQQNFGSMESSKFE